MRRAWLAWAWALGLWAPGANHALTPLDLFSFRPPAAAPVFNPQLVDKALPDECYDGIGRDYPPISPDHSCPAGRPKINQGYVWNLVEAGAGVSGFGGDQVWWGTVANPFCTARGTKGRLSEPVEETSWVCEYGQSQWARGPWPPLPPGLGDWRPAQAFSLDPTSGRITDRTPDDPLLAFTAGLRAGGAVGRIVIMAGQNNFFYGVHLFAWNSQTGDYLGSCRWPDISDLRSFHTAHGVLYGGVRKQFSGEVVRWTGSEAAPFGGPDAARCGFQTVGRIAGFPAYLTSYADQRLAVSAWPTRSTQLGAGVYLSPPFGPDGVLAPADRFGWSQVWSPALYEPDPRVRLSYSAGALAYWRGYLWFGTNQIASDAQNAHRDCGEPACFGEPVNEEESATLFFGTYRATSIWRLTMQGETPVIDLLYGQTSLPSFVPGSRSFVHAATGWAPVWGAEGFDNPFNTYAWTVLATPGRLIFGTHDQHYAVDVGFGIEPVPPDPVNLRGYGADLWRFDDPQAAATLEDARGLGNFLNYGVRSLLQPSGGGDIYLGTANPMNLEPLGGWELLRLPAPARHGTRGGPADVNVR